MYNYHGCFASDVDLWIRLAIEKKVKEFVLLLSTSGATERYHMLPQMMYSNPSWTSLSLRGCIMAPQGTIQWRSLTSLSLVFVNLDESTLEFSGCPALSSLDLVLCRGFDRLEVASPSLHRLAVEHDEDCGGLKISAPYVRTFKIDLGFECRNVCFENFKSLVSAEINFIKRDGEAPIPWEECTKHGLSFIAWDWKPPIVRSVQSNFLEALDMPRSLSWVVAAFRLKINYTDLLVDSLVQSIEHKIYEVRLISLRPRRVMEFFHYSELSTQVTTSIMIKWNWQLPHSTTPCLELHIDGRNISIPGIVLPLKSYPDLETLIIHGCVCDPGVVSSDPASKNDLYCDLFYLKTVCFEYFKPSYLETGEPMLILARILLKRVVVLEKMVFDFREKMPVDRLSALPDSILCYILSFLEMKEAAITCLLSKRWKFLWSQLPGIQFKEKYCSDKEKAREFVMRVHRTLAICSRHNLERFAVEVGFWGCFGGSFASDINVWTRFAVENKVKEFRLLLPGFQVMPQMMYSNPFLTSLTLGGCNVAPGGTIQWQSLTTLRIERVKLNENTFEKIFSGCPILSSLDLVFCSGFNRLEVNSPSLHRLVIQNIGDQSEGDLKISAPYIHSLKIEWPSTNLILENIKSLVRAEANVCQVGWDATNLWNKTIKQHFGSIRCVKMLKLDQRLFIQHLSLIALEWQLPQSTGGCNLEIHAYCGNKSIPGILYILESSPNVETLVVHFHKSSYQDNAAENEVPKNDLDCDLFYLKIVDFKSFRNPSVDTGEPMAKLAQILQKRAIALEKMVVDFTSFTASSSTT